MMRPQISVSAQYDGSKLHSDVLDDNLAFDQEELEHLNNV